MLLSTQQLFLIILIDVFKITFYLASVVLEWHMYDVMYDLICDRYFTIKMCLFWALIFTHAFKALTCFGDYQSFEWVHY